MHIPQGGRGEPPRGYVSWVDGRSTGNAPLSFLLSSRFHEGGSPPCSVNNENTPHNILCQHPFSFFRSIRDKDNNLLLPRRSILRGSSLHDQAIPYGFDPSDAPCDLVRFVDGVLRINKAAQLDDALASFNTDLE